MSRLPMVFIRNGYAMIETGNGTARQIDPVADAWILKELEVKLPPKSMDRLKEAVYTLPPWTDLDARTPRELLGARFFLKNFASRGDRAQAYVRSLPGNWQVRQIGDDPTDFAVSKDGVKWHLFDPGFGKSAAGMTVGDIVAETAVDLLDVTTDAIETTASGAAFVMGAGGTAPAGPGAIATGSVAAGATSAAITNIRQLIGQWAGIPDNVEITDGMALGALTALFSAGGPFAAKGARAAGERIKAVARGRVGQSVREGALEAGAGLLGVRSGGPTLRPERVLERRIADRAGILHTIPDMDTTASALRRLMKTTARQQIPEQPIAREMEREAAEIGVTVNVAELIDDLLEPLVKKQKLISRTAQEVAPEPTGLVDEFSKPIMTDKTKRIVTSSKKILTKEAARAQLRTEENFSSKIKGLMERINNVIIADGADPTAVPVTTAVQIRQDLDQLMKIRNAHLQAATQTGKKAAVRTTKDEYDRTLRQFNGILRKMIAREIDAIGLQAPDGRTYPQVMYAFQRQMKQLERWKLWLGTDLPDEEGQKTAVSFLRSLHKSGNLGFRQAANNIKASTGLDLIKHAERALTAELFGEQGAAKIFPRISAVGEPVGAGVGKRIVGAMGGGALLGGMAGNAPGALAGLAVGGTLASEAGELAIARYGPRIARMGLKGGAGVIKVLDQTHRKEALGAIQSLARQKILQRQPLYLQPSPDLSDEQRASAQKLLDAINALPGLTGAERMEEFSKRAESQGLYK